MQAQMKVGNKARKTRNKREGKAKRAFWSTFRSVLTVIKYNEMRLNGTHYPDQLIFLYEFIYLFIFLLFYLVSIYLFIYHLLLLFFTDV